MPREVAVVNSDGNLVPYDKEKAQQVIIDAITDGELILVVAINKEHQVALQVFTEPSWRTVDILRDVMEAMTKILNSKGIRH